MNVRLAGALAALSLLVACSREGAPVAATTTKAASPATTAAATTSAAAPPDAGAGARRPARDAGAGLSAGDRKAVLASLAEGRKKAKAKDYRGAIAAFDRALSLAPRDARVLGELGYAALLAGDLARAEDANRTALASAKEPVLRAQILYNAGRVAEERKDVATARKDYEESLALRSNAEVKRRLEAVGGAAGPTFPCATGAPSVEALCACLLADKDGPMIPEGAARFCKPDAASLALRTPRLVVVRYGAELMGEVSHLLVAREGGVLRPVAVLGTDYEPGAFGIHNEATVVGDEARTVAGRSVVVVKSEQRDVDQNLAGLEICTNDVDFETVCALGDDKGRTRCATVPVSISGGCGPGVEPDPATDDPETVATYERLKASYSPTTAKLAWTLDDAGRLVVRKASGDDKKVPDGALGTRPLF